MCLTTTTSGEAAQMTTSASSKWGLGREVWTASSIFRVRNRLECPEESLRGLIWHSNPNCGIAREEKKKKRTFLTKVSNAAQWPLVHTETKGLCPGEYQRRASWLPFRTLYPWKQRGRCATVRAGSQRATAISAPETAFPAKLWAGCKLLTTSSWDPGGSHQTRM